jgi:tetratricopeptide (TPR) repeat protein
MKPLSLLAVILLVSLFFFQFTRPDSTSINRNALQELNTRKQLSSIGCTPDWNKMSIEQLAEEMIPLPGSGKWQWKISTRNDSAQFYFNQGMNLYYAFHIVEAVPSFRKAQQFDPDCAMLYWGEALALGPNINDIGYSASLAAFNAGKKAANLQQSNNIEKLLIKAMQVRYSEDSTASQKELNELYASAMRGVYAQNSENADVASLLADALMLNHPWDFWTANGTAKEWTPEIVQLLEKILKNAPLHPGANHYYIHTVEASFDPGRAVKSAKRLATIAPMLSHLVHMPSHIYVRTGQFDEAVEVNRNALSAYETYRKLYPAVADRADLYDIHNRHMQVAGAINLENYQAALKLAQECRNSFSSEWMSLPIFGYYIQYVYMSPEMVMVAFGQWNDILNSPELSDSLSYAKLLSCFARGLSFAKKGDSTKASAQLVKIDQLLQDTSLAVPIGPLNAPRSGALVARAILNGAIAESTGDFPTAIIRYQEAVKLEDAMVYNEPKDWILPARHWLGAALLRNKQFDLARSVFEDDLIKNPGNPYSKKGLIAARKNKTID